LPRALADARAAGRRRAPRRLAAEQLRAGRARARMLTGLEEIGEQLDLGGRSVREAARGLTAPVLRDGGLQDALRELARALPLATELTCDVPRLPEELEHSVHLVAREALTNVVRHSGAQQV